MATIEQKKISQLVLAGQSSGVFAAPSSYAPIVIDGTTYRIQIGDLLAMLETPSSVNLNDLARGASGTRNYGTTATPTLGFPVDAAQYGAGTATFVSIEASNDGTLGKQVAHYVSTDGTLHEWYRTRSGSAFSAWHEIMVDGSVPDASTTVKGIVKLAVTIAQSDTGVTSAGQVYSAIITRLFNDSAIRSNSNFNNLTSDGVYNLTGTGNTNGPTVGAKGVMQVMGNGTVQSFASTETGIMWFRYGTPFGEWAKVGSVDVPEATTLVSGTVRLATYVGEGRGTIATSEQVANAIGERLYAPNTEYTNVDFNTFFNGTDGLYNIVGGTNPNSPEPLGGSLIVSGGSTIQQYITRPGAGVTPNLYIRTEVDYVWQSWIKVTSTGGSVDPADLISTDTNNLLSLGLDGKLLVTPVGNNITVDESLLASVTAGQSGTSLKAQISTAAGNALTLRTTAQGSPGLFAAAGGGGSGAITVIAAGTNLDTLVTPGIYEINAGSGSTGALNWPSDATNGSKAYLTVSTNGTAISQSLQFSNAVAIGFGNTYNASWSRAKIGAASWSSWDFYNASKVTLSTKRPLASGWATTFATGIYDVSIANATTANGFPSEAVGSAGILEVSGGGASYSHVYRTVPGNVIFQRVNNTASTFGPWKTIATVDQIPPAVAGITNVANGVNLDTLTTIGVYNIRQDTSTATPTLNWPFIVGVSTRCTLNVSNNASMIVQTVFAGPELSPENPIYFRTRVGGTWSAWSPLASRTVALTTDGSVIGDWSVLAVGMYNVSASQSTLANGAPADAVGKVNVLTVISGGVKNTNNTLNSYQTCQSITDNRMWMRSRSAVTPFAFSAWVEIGVIGRAANQIFDAAPAATMTLSGVSNQRYKVDLTYTLPLTGAGTGGMTVAISGTSRPITFDNDGVARCLPSYIVSNASGNIVITHTFARVTGTDAIPAGITCAYALTPIVI